MSEKKHNITWTLYQEKKQELTEQSKELATVLVQQPGE